MKGSNQNKKGLSANLLTWLLLAGLSVVLVLSYLAPVNLFHAPVSPVLLASDGSLLNAAIAKDGQWRFPYNPETPEKFVACITTFEDKRFFIHPGVDLLAMARAIQKTSTGSLQGGSTLSMQVIRIAGQHTNRNAWNKLTEIAQAMLLECRYSKKHILAMYASYAPFGSNVVGLDAAAWRYFGRSADKLSWAEVATLAVLPNAPGLVHPGRNRDLLQLKRNRLLKQLYDNHTFSKEVYHLALQEPLPNKPLPLPQLCPHLLQRFARDFPANKKLVRTTIDVSLQQQVNSIISLRQQQYAGNGVNNICALVMEVSTGNVLAYTGNGNALKGENNQAAVDIIGARRSPGSTLKPFLYAAMLSDGQVLPNSLVPDIPTQIGGYAPVNFDKDFDGAVPASMALARSLNIPAVRLLQQYKYQRFYETLKAVGINSLREPADHYGLSMILGGCEVSMWELAGAYASLARIANNQEKNGGIIYNTDVHPPQFLAPGKITRKAIQFPLDPTSIFFTLQAMQEVMRPGEEGLWQQFSASQKIAWKTGTSFGFRDAWAVGVTPRYVVAVWVGNADGEGRPSLIGVQYAAPVLFEIFRNLPSGKWFTRPENNYKYIPVCRQTGFRANVDCPQPDTLFMPPQADKTPLCPYHKMVHVDASGNWQVNESCVTIANMQHVSWFILPPAMEYFYKRHNHNYLPVPPFLPGCEKSGSNAPMEIIWPQANARIYVPLEISGDRGKTIFNATNRRTQAKLFWTLDDNFIGETTVTHEMALSPTAGRHILTVTDDEGNRLSRPFIILDKKNGGGAAL
ncbi:MAG: penicillin-binding protein 1C [Ferruginibacter sp.]